MSAYRSAGKQRLGARACLDARGPGSVAQPGAARCARTGRAAALERAEGPRKRRLQSRPSTTHKGRRPRAARGQWGGDRASGAARPRPGRCPPVPLPQVPARSGGGLFRSAWHPRKGVPRPRALRPRHSHGSFGFNLGSNTKATSRAGSVLGPDNTQSKRARRARQGVPPRHGRQGRNARPRGGRPGAPCPLQPEALSLCGCHPIFARPRSRESAVLARECCAAALCGNLRRGRVPAQVSKCRWHP